MTNPTVTAYPYGLTHHRTDAPADMIDAYLQTPDLHHLLHRYSEWEGTVSLTSIMEATQQWDTRRGNTRLHDTYPADKEPPLPPHVLPALHLSPSQPPLQSYDLILILGGYTAGMIRRHAHLTTLYHHHLLTGIAPVITLTSHRPSEPHELTLLPTLPTTEEWNETTLAQHIITTQHEMKPWIEHHPSSTLPFPYFYTVTATPPVMPHYLHPTPTVTATTHDTLLHFRHTLLPHLLPDLSPDRPARILIITTCIYVPYQHTESIRAFHGEPVTITTCGSPAGNNIHTAPHALLQEIHATLQAFTRLANTPIR